LVREQKQRLQERSKANESLTQQNKQMTGKLERTIDELKKIREQILLLQKERREIDARLVAQESILAGLREEKKLWSHELAHQGEFHRELRALTFDVSFRRFIGTGPRPFRIDNRNVEQRGEDTEEAMGQRSRHMSHQTNDHRESTGHHSEAQRCN
jgi:hypothetical protein